MSISGTVGSGGGSAVMAQEALTKEGPPLMILVPDPAVLEGLSTDPQDPAYVLWKGTPYAHTSYAHIMLKIAKDK